MPRVAGEGLSALESRTTALSAWHPLLRFGESPLKREPLNTIKADDPKDHEKGRHHSRGVIKEAGYPTSVHAEALGQRQAPGRKIACHLATRALAKRSQHVGE